MKKELKDYLHLYQNIDVKIASDRKAERKMDTMIYATGEYAHCTKSNFPYSQDIPYKNVKPILRPLSSITNTEVIEIVALLSDVYLLVKHTGNFSYGIDFEFQYNSSNRRRVACQRWDELNPEQFIYLLSKHFDLFGLIESGLAIDKTTLTP